VIETATAEVNHPMWSKAIASVLQRALAMLAKPRYWSVGFPLLVVTLGVSPREVFMQHWAMLIEHIQLRFKASRSTYQIVAVSNSRAGSSYSASRLRCLLTGSMDLLESMHGIKHVNAETTRPTLALFPCTGQSQCARPTTRTIHCHAPLCDDSTP
jgi:hypothetical protein